MNAVNLIPSDTRTRSDGLNVSPPTLALMGGLLVALIAAVLYVTAANTVSTRKSELAQVTAGVAGWTAAVGAHPTAEPGELAVLVRALLTGLAMQRSLEPDTVSDELAVRGLCALLGLADDAPRPESPRSTRSSEPTETTMSGATS